MARRESPDEVAGHLGQISDTARELTRTMDEIVWAVNPRHDSLDGLVTYICQFAQEYLTLAGIQLRSTCRRTCRRTSPLGRCSWR